MSEKRHKIITIIFVLVFLGFLSSFAWCEDPCIPTPDPFPSDGVIQGGTHRIPPEPPETVVTIRTETGEIGYLSLQDWRLVVDWRTEPAWWPDEGELEETYWFLDEYPTAYCRFTCSHLPGEDGYEWICHGDCWAAFAESMTYRYYESLDCGVTWTVVTQEQIAYVPPITVRRARLRLAPVLPETG